MGHKKTKTKKNTRRNRDFFVRSIASLRSTIAVAVIDEAYAWFRMAMMRCALCCYETIYAQTVCGIVLYAVCL